MLSNRQNRLSHRFRPVSETLECRSLMAVGQISLFIPSVAAGSNTLVRGSLPDGSIDVQQFNVATSNPTTINSTTGGAGAGKVQFGALNVVFPLGTQSTGLFQAEASETHFNTATLTIRNAAAQLIETLSFKLVYVTSDTTAGTSGGDPTESVTFAYGAIQDTTFNPTTLAQTSQTSFSQITNSATFTVAGVTSLSLPKTPSTSSNTQTVSASAVASAIPTTIKLTSAKSHHGTTILTAKVASKHGVPTGNVTFYSGKIELGQVVVGSTGQATLSVSSALLGKSKPYAVYSGTPGSTFQAATSVAGEPSFVKSFQKWFGRPMTQDEWVLTSQWSQQGLTLAKMTDIYKSLATQSS